MGLFVRVAIFFYVFLISVIGISSLLFLVHFIDLKTCLDFLAFLYNDWHASMFAELVIVALMIISLLLARIIYGRQEKERIISFDNPLGRVTISLSAIEDLIRRMASLIPQIKELKPEIKSSKKGLEADIKLVLRTDVNIPEMTADLQDRIKRKVHDVVGAEERVNIRVHVVKISSDLQQPKKGQSSDSYDDAEDSTIPFRHYRS
jgi:hypothetical protein